MSFSIPVRSVCRGMSRRLLDDVSGASQQRAFSHVHRTSYPRIKPLGAQPTRLHSFAANSEELGKEIQSSMRENEHKSDGIPRIYDDASKGLSLGESPEMRNMQNSQLTKTKESTSPPILENPLAKSNQEPSIPWYLQSQHAITKPAAPEHLLERQRIPDMPENAPEVLHELLQYVSADLGIDYLTLLDLRSLDPPAALGANLIMVVGTARGEKHLHVSADRCCRWLRSNHQLRPKADGLLGRNELKIKMRRKAKRLKVLAHVGSADSPGVDDGMRTGWVCVNISGIKSVEVKDKIPEHVEHGFVGFGESSSDTTIILHMLTEDKREELELETLWTNRLKRRKIKASEGDFVWGSFSGDRNSEGKELIG